MTEHQNEEKRKSSFVLVECACKINNCCFSSIEINSPEDVKPEGVQLHIVIDYINQSYIFKIVEKYLLKMDLIVY